MVDFRRPGHILILYVYYDVCVANLVRLIGDSSHIEGRLEVYYNGRWGTVCNDGWNDEYASLVCKQFGFGSSGKLADFGAGTGSIFLEKVMCSSNDTILASCGHYGVGISVHCNHYDDVGVKCDGNLRVCFILYILTSAFRCNNSVRNYANS